MSCRIYIQKYSYENIERGKRKKQESANGMVLLSYAVKDSCGIDTSLLHIARGDHGKPYFENSSVMFNISHSGDYAAAAVCSLPVGVDIQIFRNINERMIEKLCRYEELEYIRSAPDKNKAFVHLWSLKESYIKATGDGMSFPMDSINFDIRGFSGELCGRFSNREGFYFLREYRDFALAACVLDVGV